jgi:hypothetical protein
MAAPMAGINHKAMPGFISCGDHDSSQREHREVVFHSSLVVESPWLKTGSPRLEAHDQRTRKDVDKLLIARARGLGKRNIVQGITQVLENDIFGLTGVDSAG